MKLKSILPGASVKEVLEMDIRENPFKLGFGLMRLPKNEDGSIDIPQVIQMADSFLEAGGTYFDTAYVYDSGESEKAFKTAVADRYPRDRYTVATKLNAWSQCHDEASAKAQFFTSLERTGAGYFDFYLLHALQRNNYTIVKQILDEAAPGMTYASWAIRFVASQENLLAVLSGMSSLEQMEDNLSYMKNFQPLNDLEMESIRKAQQAIEEDKSIPCTVCHYCTKGCPQSIPIPEIFAVENRKKGSPHFRTVREYNIVTQGLGRAGDCIQCGQCEGACPQHLPIIGLILQSCLLILYTSLQTKSMCFL